MSDLFEHIQRIKSNDLRTNYIELRDSIYRCPPCERNILTLTKSNSSINSIIATRKNWWRYSMTSCLKSTYVIFIFFCLTKEISFIPVKKMMQCLRLWPMGITKWVIGKKPKHKIFKDLFLFSFWYNSL